MAKARTYTRDSRGRFASGGGGGQGGGGKGKAKGPMGALSARTSLRRSREKLAANPSSAQKGAVTRASRKLAEARKAAQRTMPKRGGPAGVMKGKVKRDPGAMAKARAGVIRSVARKSSAAKPAQTKQPIDMRLARVKSKINAKAIAVKDELRKVDNAKNRDNSTSITPKWQKLMQREARAERAARSVMRASKAVRRIEMAATPEKFGYTRGSQQRRELAAQIRQQRRAIKYAAKAESQAKLKYESSPVVKHGLTSEIGGNRRQSKKAKSRASARQTGIVDAYIAARINTRELQKALSELRATAKTQTSKTNAAKRRR